MDAQCCLTGRYCVFIAAEIVCGRLKKVESSDIPQDVCKRVYRDYVQNSQIRME